MAHIVYLIDGVEYTSGGWYGSQLKSVERTNKTVGDVRNINGYLFYVTNITRTSLFKLKREISWCLVFPPNTPYETRSEMIHQFYSSLKG